MRIKLLVPVVHGITAAHVDGTSHAEFVGLSATSGLSNVNFHETLVELLAVSRNALCPMGLDWTKASLVVGTECRLRGRSLE